jgi:hypothetical protein
MSARGTAFADFDNDGDIDVLVVDLNDGPNLYRNEGGRNHLITFRLEGVRSNASRSALGSRSMSAAARKLRRSGAAAAISHNDIRVHFGLGDSARIDRVRVRWPNSPMQEFTNSQRIVSSQFEKLEIRL